MTFNRGIVFISLRTMHTNLGDAMLTRALLAECIRSATVFAQAGRVPAPFLRFVSEGVDDDSLRLLNASYWPTLLRFSIESRLRAMRGVQSACPRPVLVLNPGHQLLRSDVRTYFRKALHLVLLAMVRVAGGRVVKLGFSLPDRSPSIAVLLERAQARLCNVYLARDWASASKSPVASPSAEGIVPDLAVLLQEPAIPRYHGSLEHERVLGVSIRQCGLAHVAALPVVRQIWESLGSPTVVAFSQTGRDLEPTRTALAAGEIEAALESELTSTVASASDLANHYRGFSFVVSNRLHVVLAALLEGTPALAVGTRNANDKVFSALRAIGLDRVCLELGQDALDREDVSRRVDWVSQNTEQISTVLEQQKSVAEVIVHSALRGG